MDYKLQNIPDGRAGTQATVREMANLVAQSQLRPTVRLASLSILEKANVKTRNTAAVIRALFEWTRRNVQYLHDPLDVESVQSPEVTLQIKVGDCDDHSTLMAAFAANLGIPARFVTIGYSQDRMVHVFGEFLVDGQWIAADTTQSQPLGYTPALPVRVIYNLKGDTMNSLGRATEVLDITVEELQSRMYNAAYNQLRLNWQTGKINRADVASYIRVIDEGNGPGRGTIAETPMRAAIADWLTFVDRGALQSSKPAGKLNGMEGLDGFLRSVWDAIWGAVKSIPGVGQILQSGESVLRAIIGKGGTNTTGAPSWADIEASINSPEPFDINVIVSWAQGTGWVSWLPITSKNSFLKPPTLPMYLMTKPGMNPGSLSMEGDRYVPFAGYPQTESGGQGAVNEIVTQFGVGAALYLSVQDFYTVNQANVSSPYAGVPGSISTTVESLLSSPLVLVGLVGLGVYLIARRD